MLLRSASSPILNSWAPAGKEFSPDHPAAELAPHHHTPKAVSVSQASSPSVRRMMTRALSDGDLSNPSAALKRGRPLASRGLSSIPLKEEEEQNKVHDSCSPLLGRLLSSSGLDGLMMEGIDECCVVDAKSSATLVVGGWDGSGGRICGGVGGGAGGGDGDAGFGFSDSSKGTDAYYLKMMEANPGNSLVLGNYARFLKEVRGDLGKAEEYCERAILANPGDADILSLYADIVWQTSKDADRAERYFDQAVQAAPQDCYVMASYARFLWDAEEEEEEEKDGAKESDLTSPPLFQGLTTPSIAAAS